MEFGCVSWPGGPIDAAELRTRLDREGYDVWQWTDAPGASYAPHTHERDENIWVLAGDITFEALGRSVRLGPGDRLLLPKGTVHAARAGGDGATYLVGERR